MDATEGRDQDLGNKYSEWNLLLKKRKGKEMILGNFVSLRFERFKDKTKRIIYKIIFYKIIQNDDQKLKEN